MIKHKWLIISGVILLICGVISTVIYITGVFIVIQLQIMVLVTKYGKKII